jgi:hypothetical protein
LRECLWLGMSLVACGQTTAGNDNMPAGTNTAASAVTSDGRASADSVSTNGPGTSSGSGSGAGGAVGGAGTTGVGAQSSGSGLGGDGSSTTTGAGGMSSGSAGSDTGTTGSTGEAGEGGVGATDGTSDLPNFEDLIIFSSTMGDYEGLTVYVAYDHNLTPDSRSEARSAVVASGAFEVVWAQGFNRDTFGAYAFLFVDVDGDAACTEGPDPVWSFFVNNLFSEGEPVVVEVDLRPETTTVLLTEADCELFINGLSGGRR